MVTEWFFVSWKGILTKGEATDPGSREQPVLVDHQSERKRRDPIGVAVTSRSRKEVVFSKGVAPSVPTISP
jgi:hypothetical protein